jgi:hypothetical protein
MPTKPKGKVRRMASVQEILRNLNSTVLNFENIDDFDQFRRALESDFGPQCAFEEIYISDIINLSWEIWRLRIFKKDTLNRMFFNKLFELLVEKYVPKPDPTATAEFEALLEAGETGNREKLDAFERRRQAERKPYVDLVNGWFTDEKARQEIQKLLGKETIDEIQMSILNEIPAGLEPLDQAIATL